MSRHCTANRCRPNRHLTRSAPPPYDLFGPMLGPTMTVARFDLDEPGLMIGEYDEDPWFDDEDDQ